VNLLHQKPQHTPPNSIVQGSYIQKKKLYKQKRHQKLMSFKFLFPIYLLQIPKGGGQKYSIYSSGAIASSFLI
jgi:hypothetical protein